MTPKEIKALDDAYRHAMKGTTKPDLMMANIPNIGYVVMTRKAVTVNDEPATEDQLAAIKKYFKL